MPRPWQKYSTLLRVRERQERLKAQVLAEARRETRRAELQRDALGDEQRRILLEAGEAALDEVDAPKVQSFFHYERHLAHLSVEKDAEIQSLRRVEEKKRAELEDALKRRKIVERLSERVREEYAKHVRKEEQKLLDETAAVRAALSRKDYGA